MDLLVARTLAKIPRITVPEMCDRIIAATALSAILIMKKAMQINSVGIIVFVS
jgi:hypothetical protein